MESDSNKSYVFDSCVLIDYVDSQAKILTLFSKHVGPAVVVSDLLEEIEQLSVTKCKKLGLSLYHPDTKQLIEARGHSASISTLDHLCLIVARDEGWICVTNDVSLQEACRESGVKVIRGLRPLLELAERNLVKEEDALEIAEMIYDSNDYITRKVIDDFKGKLKRL